MLIGIDRIKDVAVLERAYDDPAGVTAAFNLNLLERINRELGGDIAVENFTHRAVWNDTHARIEMHLVAACDMAFTVDGQDYRMAKGETIHSENSHRSEEHTSELQSLMRISYAVFCLKKKNRKKQMITI